MQLDRVLRPEESQARLRCLRQASRRCWTGWAYGSLSAALIDLDADEMDVGAS